MKEQTPNRDLPSKGPEAILHSPTFLSNAIHLSAREWVVAAVTVLAIVIGTPAIWKQAYPFDPPIDFRVPYALSNDYWTYQRWVEAARARDRILVIGDSVVWGEYVDPEHTLSHYLNEVNGRARFANGGVNGTHPLALEGLVHHYAGAVANTRVILHCNLLWMSSEERDLQSDKQIAFNHPRLVPQFTPRVPSYDATVDERIGVVIDHAVPYRRWVRHLRVADFDGLDVHSWTLEHPYADPFMQIRLQTPRPENTAHSEPISWTERGIEPQDIPWIDLDTSLQWQAFRATADVLQARGNRVFVIVGPFNEHMLTAASRERYRAMVQQVEAWLRDNAVPYYAAELLPSEEYADASHPLEAGYARLGKDMFENQSFQQWFRGPGHTK